jgi:hypothetical protein
MLSSLNWIQSYFFFLRGLSSFSESISSETEKVSLGSCQAAGEGIGELKNLFEVLPGVKVVMVCFPIYTLNDDYVFTLF